MAIKIVFAIFWIFIVAIKNWIPKCPIFIVAIKICSKMLDFYRGDKKWNSQSPDFYRGDKNWNSQSTDFYRGDKNWNSQILDFYRGDKKLIIQILDFYRDDKKMCSSIREFCCNIQQSSIQCMLMDWWFTQMLLPWAMADSSFTAFDTDQPWLFNCGWGHQVTTMCCLQGKWPRLWTNVRGLA